MPPPPPPLHDRGVSSSSAQPDDLRGANVPEKLHSMAGAVGERWLS